MGQRELYSQYVTQATLPHSLTNTPDCTLTGKLSQDRGKFIDKYPNLTLLKSEWHSSEIFRDSLWLSWEPRGNYTPQLPCVSSLWCDYNQNSSSVPVTAKTRESL